MTHRFHKRRFISPLLMTVAAAGLLTAQPDAPFDAPDDPFRVDPEAVESPPLDDSPETGTGEATAETPFTAPQTDPFETTPFEPGSDAPDPAEAEAGANFDLDGQPAEGSPFDSPDDPFAAPEDPFAATESMMDATEDPFAEPEADPFTEVFETPETDPGTDLDPFADPFATPSDPFAADDADGAGVTPPADPFGGGTGEDQAGPADPFEVQDAPVDPFTGGAPADPFGGETGTAAPADPFATDDGTTAQPSDDPFAPATDPGRELNPLMDAAGSIAGNISGEGGDAAEGAVNPDGISEVYEFRFERRLLWDGTRTVVRRRLTSEEAERFDEAARQRYIDAATANTLAGYVPGEDIDAWAEWSVFGDQYQLWSEYVNTIVLGGYEDGENAFDAIQWPGQPFEEEDGEEEIALAGPTTGAEAVVAANQGASIDDQLNDIANPFAGIGGGGAQGAIIPPELIIDQIVTVYDSLQSRLEGMEREQEEFMNNFEERLAERNTRRLAYADWKTDQRTIIEDFVNDWNRRYTGEVAMIGGIRYELYRPGEVPDRVQRDATVVVTDYRLTPYDIIDPETGELKQAPGN